MNLAQSHQSHVPLQHCRVRGIILGVYTPTYEGERWRYETQMSKISPTSRERLLYIFDHSEKKQDLYRKSKDSQNEELTRAYSLHQKY